MSEIEIPWPNAAKKIHRKRECTNSEISQSVLEYLHKS